MKRRAAYAALLKIAVSERPLPISSPPLVDRRPLDISNPEPYAAICAVSYRKAQAAVTEHSRTAAKPG
jgi:hypothetical protein